MTASDTTNSNGAGGPGTVSVVTGANSGIGRAIALHLAASGHTVYGTVRSLDKAAKLNAMADAAGVELNLVELDIADDDSVRDGLARVLAEAGRIDVLVNNAGIGGNGVVEEASVELYDEVMNVNVYGAIRCLKAVLPGMRERRAGTIVNITSVVGRFAHQGQAPYVASKWAFEGLSEELAHELAPLGIRVAIIEPGITKSAIFAKNPGVTDNHPDYDSHTRRMLRFYEVGLRDATDPAEVAHLVLHAITTDTPKLRYGVSWGGPEILAGRQTLSDEDYVALGAITDDNEFYGAFNKAFGVDLSEAP
jgi:NAD(P)-dependent dehydrogenase (short-subunit alcohol dehydrogenase family)